MKAEEKRKEKKSRRRWRRKGKEDEALNKPMQFVDTATSNCVPQFVSYNETCLNEHSHIITTCVHRPDCYVHWELCFDTPILWPTWLM